VGLLQQVETVLYFRKDQRPVQEDFLKVRGCPSRTGSNPIFDKKSYKRPDQVLI
jgi:hypothetical protein